MKWLDRLFHEPRDPEVATIKNALTEEKNRHHRELVSIESALTDLASEYARAELERRRDVRA